jgi:hypothetical protein
MKRALGSGFTVLAERGRITAAAPSAGRMKKPTHQDHGAD